MYLILTFFIKLLSFLNFTIDRWLIDLALDLRIDGIKCLLEYKGGIMAFLQPCDALQLCERILEVSAVYSPLTPVVYDNYLLAIVVEKVIIVHHGK